MENQKNKLRQEMQRVRGLIPETRKHSAGKKLADLFSGNSGLTLSYASFGSELSTAILNESLAKKGLLVLPKVDGDRLRLFNVQDPFRQLMRARFNLMEPDPSCTEEVFPYSLACALIPGLAFDLSAYRLGYGRGYYDRFLKILPHAIETVGIGYQEQCTVTPLPREEHDLPVQRLALL